MPVSSCVLAMLTLCQSPIGRGLTDQELRHVLEAGDHVRKCQHCQTILDWCNGMRHGVRRLIEGIDPDLDQPLCKVFSAN